MRSPNTSSRRFNVSDARLSTPGGYYVQPTVGHGAEAPPAHVVLRLIFLKYISEAFEERHARLEGERAQGADPGGPRRVPRREHLLGAARGPLGAAQDAGEATDDRPAPRARRAASSTPRVVLSSFLVQMLDPYQDRVYDPCCGSSGMFVQSVEFIRAHATGNGNGGKAPKGTRADISIWGQESNYTTWRLAKMIGAASGSPMTSAGNTAPRPRGMPTLPGCSIWSITWRRTAWLASCSPMARCPPTSRARARLERA